MRHHRIAFTRHSLTAILVVCCVLVPGRLVQVIAAGGSCFLGVSTEPGDPSVTETEFELEFESEIWSVAVEVTFEGSDWDELEIEMDGTVGDLTLDSELEFEPDKNRWKHWKTEIEWTVDFMTVEVTPKLSRTSDWLTFEMEQELEDAEVDTRLRLRAPTGSCLFTFYDADLEVDFTWCGIDSEIALAFDDDGFDELTLEWSDATLAAFPGVLADVEVAIDLVEWKLEVDPALSAVIEGCVEIEIEAELPGFPCLGELREPEIVACWEFGPWEAEATIRLDPDDWIDDLYWLEVETGFEIDLLPRGELATTLVLDWAETALGRIEVESVYSPTERIALGTATARDLDTGQLEEIALTMELDW